MGEADFIGSHVDTCPDCGDDTDPVDDCFYCSTCKGQGWIYQNMLDAPHLSHADAREILAEDYRDGMYD